MDGNKLSVLPHKLLQAHFNELASGSASSPAVIDQLRTTQLSRRLGLLRAFWLVVEAHPELFGPLPPIGEAWSILEHTQRHHPRQFESLIGQPHTGSWLAYSLRRHRGGATSDAPWYVDFGQLNVLAVAAAALTGTPFKTRVPLRDGRVMIPCFGMANFEGCGAWEVAEAEADDGRIRLSHRDRSIVAGDADGDGWWPLRRVTVGDGPVLTVWLDDLDPLRDLADPVPPARLSEEDFQRWSELLHGAWKILSHHHPEEAASLAVGLTSLVPLPAGEGWDTRSASTGDAFGAVMCSPPPDAVTLAVSLVHEFAHIRLGGLMHLLPLTAGTDQARLYAPWRDDPRPLGGLIQGIYAFVHIAAFWRRQRLVETGVDRQLAEFEYAYSWRQAQEGLDNARTAAGLTEHGVAFLAGITAELDSWSEDWLPEEVSALSRLVAIGHRTGWRLRNRRPRPDDIDALADAWRNRDTSEIRVEDSDVLADPNMHHWSQGWLGLARRRIQAPQHFLESLEEPWGRGLTHAHLALFSGEAETAVKEFSEQIAHHGEADAWAGLGLALSADPSDGGARAILRRPELVRAVYQRVAVTGDRPAPAEVARWIGKVTAA